MVRGEALASITAVSKVTLTTSTGEDSGVELKLGLVKSKKKDRSTVKGNDFPCRRFVLQYTTRLKFDSLHCQTELAHITDVVSKASLSHPEIAFILKMVICYIQTSGKGDLLQNSPWEYWTRKRA